MVIDSSEYTKKCIPCGLLACLAANIARLFQSSRIRVLFFVDFFFSKPRPSGESACGIPDQTVDAATLCSGVLLIAASQQTLVVCLSVHLPKQDLVD